MACNNSPGVQIMVRARFKWKAKKKNSWKCSSIGASRIGTNTCFFWFRKRRLRWRIIFRPCSNYLSKSRKTDWKLCFKRYLTTLIGLITMKFVRRLSTFSWNYIWKTFSLEKRVNMNHMRVNMEIKQKPTIFPYTHFDICLRLTNSSKVSMRTL